MNITTLAATTISLLVPFLTKGGEKIAEDIASDMWNLIKKPFQKGNHDELDDLENDPEDTDNQVAARKRLKKLLQEDPDLVSALTNQFKKIPERTISKINDITFIGDDNINTVDLTNSTVNINKPIIDRYSGAMYILNGNIPSPIYFVYFGLIRTSRLHL